MQQIAKISIQKHQIESPMPGTGIARTQSVVYLFRVVGKSPTKAANLCRKRLDDMVFPPVVALTLDGLRRLAQAHIEVSLAVKRTCQSLHRPFHLCGVNDANRELMARAGLLDDMDAENVHDNAALLLFSLSHGERSNTGKRSVPDRNTFATPFAMLLPLTPHSALSRKWLC